MALSLWNDSFFTDPFGEFQRMQKQIDNFFTIVPFNGKQEFWKPTCDLKETDKSIILHAELPGVNKEDISIELKDGLLHITGEKKMEKKEDNEKFQRVERSYGKFSRTIAVPKDITAEQITAKFSDGVLEVTFPKPEAPKTEEPKKIAIQSKLIRVIAIEFCKVVDESGESKVIRIFSGHNFICKHKTILVTMKKGSVFHGVVKDGVKNASIWLDKFNDDYSKKLGMKVFPGSLNVKTQTPFKMIDTTDSTPQDAIDQNLITSDGVQIVLMTKEEYNGERDILMVPCTISKPGNDLKKNAFIWRTTNADKGSVGTNPAHYVLEIVADTKLREFFPLQNDEEVIVALGHNM